MEEPKKCFYDFTNSKTGEKKKLELEVLETVYDPREDSFLVARNINIEKDSKVLEIGAGCGLISIIAALQGAQVTAVDVNPKALECTQKNAQKYSLEIRTVRSDMFERVKDKYDYIIFNPPYAPVDKESEIKTETEDKELEMKAVEGGEKGREYIDRFITQFPNYLNPGGTVYLLNSSKNNIEQTQKKLESLGFKQEIVEQINLFFEKLYLFKIWR